jgi:hypothetical protein
VWVTWHYPIVFVHHEGTKDTKVSDLLH